MSSFDWFLILIGFVIGGAIVTIVITMIDRISRNRHESDRYRLYGNPESSRLFPAQPIFQPGLAVFGPKDRGGLPGFTSPAVTSTGLNIFETPDSDATQEIRVVGMDERDGR